MTLFHTQISQLLHRTEHLLKLGMEYIQYFSL